MLNTLKSKDTERTGQSTTHWRRAFMGSTYSMKTKTPQKRPVHVEVSQNFEPHPIPFIVVGWSQLLSENGEQIHIIYICIYIYKMASNCPSMGKHIFSAIPLYQYPHYINLIHCCIYICLHQSHSIQVLIYIYIPWNSILYRRTGS